MEICVLVRSTENLTQAGTRIRYQRLAAPLRALGHGLAVQPMDALRSTAQLTQDVVLLSKCHDTRAPLLAQLLAGSGKAVGIDLFDDVFSQAGDSRLRPERAWLRSMAPHADFALASTERMQGVAAHFLPGVPIHRLADPAAPIDAQAMSRACAGALERARRTRHIDVAWFGMGDNPYFEVGLHDLHAFAPALAALRRDGWQPTLRILTNRRAMTTTALERLSRLPLPWTLEEWSEEAEGTLLAQSLVAFLPVRVQAFSTAKSLNRGVTALSAGLQVLSSGHALYAPLDPFVYRDPAELVRDLGREHLRVRPETLPALQAALERHAGAGREALALAAFLQQRVQARRPRARSTDTMAVLHGVRSDKVVHEFAQRTRQLSVAGPYANPGLNYDLRFVAHQGRLQAQLGDAALALLKPAHQSALVAATSPAGRAVKALDVTLLAPAAAETLRLALGETLRVERLARYEEATAAVTELTAALLQRVRPLLSEAEAPFGTDLDAAAGS